MHLHWHPRRRLASFSAESRTDAAVRKRLPRYRADQCDQWTGDEAAGFSPRSSACAAFQQVHQAFPLFSCFFFFQLFACLDFFSLSLTHFILISSHYRGDLSVWQARSLQRQRGLNVGGASAHQEQSESPDEGDQRGRLIKCSEASVHTARSTLGIITFNPPKFPTIQIHHHRQNKTPHIFLNLSK